MFLNEKIREARLEKKLTQKQLAEELTKRGKKTSNTAIANWESGLNNPDIDTLQLICEITDKDGNYFFDNNSSNNFRTASYNGIDVEGLDEDEIKHLNELVEFYKSKKKNNSSNK